MAVNVTVQPFGEFEGKAVHKYTIVEDDGIRVAVINYGATVTGILVPGRNGEMGDVVLGFDTLEGYIQSGQFYFGGICGRYANRIAEGRFRINGKEYRLSKNIGMGCLHGGFRGFDKKYWEAVVFAGNDGVRFTYQSADGEEGFPGNLETEIDYRVIDNALHIEYRAATDKATPVNLTSHCYFNLSGGTRQDILSHELMIQSDRIVEVNEGYIPTGKLKGITGSPLDFTRLKKIGEPNTVMTEYDYSWVLNQRSGQLATAASLVHRDSGRCMTVLTSQPAVHFYSGNFLDGKMTGTKNGHRYGKYAGLCLETQHFPDSPNHPEFPNTIVQPGEIYSEKTVYRFSGINETNIN